MRQGLLKAAQGNTAKIPQIIADVLVLTLADHSFGSGFLVRESMTLFNSLSAEHTESSIERMLPLLGAMQRFLTPIELREATDAALEALSSTPGLGVDEQVRALLLLMFIERGDKDFNKTLKRKLNKLRRNYPETFRKLLPSPRDGYRKASK